MMPFSLTQIFTSLGIAVAVFFGGFAAGHRIESNSRDAAELKIAKAVKVAYDAKALELNKIAADLEVAKNESRTITQTITKRVDRYIDRPIYINSCVDDSGLSDINAAITGKLDTGQPDAAVPTNTNP